MKRFLLLLSGLSSAAMAQVAPPANVTMANGAPRATTPSISYCLDGTNAVVICPVAAAGSSATPTGTAGSPNSQVVSVQGVSGGTPQPISATALPLPIGAATSANQASMLAQMPAVATNGSVAPTTGLLLMGSDGTNARPFAVSPGGGLTLNAAGTTQVTGTVASGATDSGGPIKTGGKVSTSTPTALGAGLRTDQWYGPNGQAYVVIVDGVGNSAGVNTPADATSAAVLGVGVRGFGQVFNGTSWDRARGDTNGTYTVSKGGSGMATGQVSVGTTATLIAAARTGRQKIGVAVTTAVQCAYGNLGVTLTTGWPLAAVAYASDSWDTAAALYGVCASTATVAYREQF